MNTKIIPNCVDISEYYDEGDENFILYAGRLNKVKGIEYLVRAFYELKNEYKHNLILIGSGPDANRLKKIVSSLNIDDRVKFIPWLNRPKLREYYARCSVFVLPSLFETFGIVVLEAMASGKPVIASNITGPKDIITHEHDGFLFEKGDIAKLRKYLELCLSDEQLKNKIGRNARKTVEQNYIFEKTAKRLEEIYERMLEAST